MFQKPPPIKGPPGSTESFEVRSSKGQRPFTTRANAQSFADGLRAEGNWAEIAHVIKIVVDKRK